MRGLPPVPFDVVELEQSFDINGHTVSIGFWLFNGSNADAIVADLLAISQAFFLTCLGSLYEVMHSGSIASTCRVAGGGQRVVSMAPPGHGAWTAGQADNVATGLHWITGQRGPLRGPITFVPAVPDAFIDSNWRLNSLAWGNLLASGTDLYHALNALPAPDGTTQVVGTLHRSVGGVPMSVAEFAPYIGVVPTPKLVTIRRRIPSRGGVSP